MCFWLFFRLEISLSLSRLLFLSFSSSFVRFPSRSLALVLFSSSFSLSFICSLCLQMSSNYCVCVIYTHILPCAATAIAAHVWILQYYLFFRWVLFILFSGTVYWVLNRAQCCCWYVDAIIIFVVVVQHFTVVGGLLRVSLYT